MLYFIQNIMVDFHIHTNASDGQYSPSEIIKKAQNLGLSVIAITDHDTVAGLEEAENCVKTLNFDDHRPKLLHGIELSISWNTSGEFHLLGLGFKTVSERLRYLIENLQKNRNLRNEIIISKMNDSGIKVTIEEVQAQFPNRVIGRPHFAAFLVEKKIAKNNQTAFKNFLARGKQFYVERMNANLDEAVTAIVESGGAPVIAHPLSLYKSWGKIGDTLKEIFERGVVGMEAYHSGATLHDCKRLEEMARKHGFFVTAGSDFHGEAVRADRKMGFTAGDKKIEDRFWTEELEPYLMNNL